MSIQKYLDTCGRGLNEIFPHVFHELKTKGFDVIGVNVFQEHFHVVVVQLRQRNVQKMNSGANTTALPNTKLKLPYGAAKR